ncbi:hypothetical protein [Streptomyces avermitilis]|uniref:hypothetical protein n=1 Tax=Streptomyces avermitilis TaxID=33903 RepID=UPI0033A48CF9
MRKVLCQVVGCGPAALGLLVAADRMGVLPQLAGRGGLLFLDRSRNPAALSARRFPYLIDSNSQGADFVRGVRADGAFARVLRGRAGRLLAESRAEQVPLSLVGGFVDGLTDVLKEVLDDGLVCGADITEVRRSADDTWTSVDATGHPIARSPHVVLATGGYEDAARTAARHGIAPRRLIASGELLAGDLREAGRVLYGGGRVAILGGSHSGFSAAALLLDRFGEAVPREGLVLLHRTLALAHTSAHEAELYVPGLAGGLEVCADTGLVNRFHGLRGGARGLCLKAMDGREPRLRLLGAETPQARAVLTEAGLVVHAAGYRTRPVALLDPDGERIDVRAPRGRVAVDERCHVVDSRGLAVEGVQGLGLGYARSDAWGHRRVGINVFHGADAETIVSTLLTRSTTAA